MECRPNRSKKYGDVYFDLGVDMMRESGKVYNQQSRWYNYIEIYRPSTYTKLPNYTDYIKRDPDRVKMWMEEAIRNGVRLDNENVDDYMVNVNFEGDYRVEAFQVWEKVMYRDFPQMVGMMHSNEELQNQLSDLVNEFVNSVGGRTRKPEDHRLLDKYFPRCRWDFYNPSCSNYKRWLNSPYRNVKYNLHTDDGYDK